MYFERSLFDNFKVGFKIIDLLRLRNEKDIAACTEFQGDKVDTYPQLLDKGGHNIFCTRNILG